MSSLLSSLSSLSSLSLFELSSSSSWIEMTRTRERVKMTHLIHHTCPGKITRP